MKTAYLVTSKKELAGFSLASDRDYFAVPVLVEIVGQTETGLLIVRDHGRGHTYPCCRSDLKSEYALTRRQLESARNRRNPNDATASKVA